MEIDYTEFAIRWDGFTMYFNKPLMFDEAIHVLSTDKLTYENKIEYLQERIKQDDIDKFLAPIR